MLEFFELAKWAEGVAGRTRQTSGTRAGAVTVPTGWPATAG